MCFSPSALGLTLDLCFQNLENIPYSLLKPTRDASG
jgi:hypothetical protein